MQMNGDCSRKGLKAVLLHNGNELSSIPLAHATNMKETYEDMVFLLDRIRYKKYNWHICANFKVISLLLGLKNGYTKFCCFLCEWDCMNRKAHYIRKMWLPRVQFQPRQKNVSHRSLVNPDHMCLPPLHIKLGVMKDFVKTMDTNSEAFNYLKRKFPWLECL